VPLENTGSPKLKVALMCGSNRKSWTPARGQGPPAKTAAPDVASAPFAQRTSLLASNCNGNKSATRGGVSGGSCGRGTAKLRAVITSSSISTRMNPCVSKERQGHSPAREPRSNSVVFREAILRLEHDDARKLGQGGFYPLPDPDRDIFGRGVFEPLDIVQITMVEPV
jgi:hypothetical protein